MESLTFSSVVTFWSDSSRKPIDEVVFLCVIVPNVVLNDPILTLYFSVVLLTGIFEDELTNS